MKARRSAAALIFASIVLLALVAPNGVRSTAAQPQQANSTTNSPPVELVNTIEPNASVVVVQGNYAYVGVGSHLDILNISDPANPTLYKQSGDLPGGVRSIVVDSIYVYVGGAGTFTILNRDDPTNRLGFLTLPNANLFNMVFADGYIYVADGPGGLHIINVTEPANPAEVSSYHSPYAAGLAVINHFVYVSMEDAGLRVLDVSNPGSPKEVGDIFPTGDTPVSIAVKDNYAYIGTASALLIADVTEPAKPRLAGGPIGTSSVSVVVQGNYVYTAYDDYPDRVGLGIIDVTNPTTPNETNFYATSRETFSVAAAGSYIYVADGTNGLLILRINTAKTLNVTIILARASDGPQPLTSNTADYYRNTIFPKVAQYHSDNSYNKVQLSLLAIKTDNNGQYFKLNNLPSSYQEKDFIAQAILTACGNQGKDCPDTDIFAVVHSGSSPEAAFFGFDVNLLHLITKLPTNTYSPLTTLPSMTLDKPFIILGETDPIGMWTHEIGHALGWYLPSDHKTLTPHPTHGDYFFCGKQQFTAGVCDWDLLAYGGTKGGLPNPGSRPTYMSSITRHFLGFIDYKTALRHGTYWIDALETNQPGDKAFKLDIDSTHCYVLETRTNDAQYSYWDQSAPSTGLVIYAVDTHGIGACGDISYQNANPDQDSDQTFNVVGAFDPSLLFNTYHNAKDNIKIKVVKEERTATNYRLQVQIDPWVNQLGSPVKGVAVRGGSTFLQAALQASGLGFELPGPPLPDIDLHLYTDDGRHIGINYATGAFENQVADSEISGDQFNGQESILVPASIAGTHFIVSDIRAVQFLAAFPQLQASLSPTDTFEITGIAAAPNGAAIVTSPITETLPLGGSREIPLRIKRTVDGSFAVTLGQPKLTIDSLIAELDSFYATGAIKSAKRYHELRADLLRVKALIQRENDRAADKHLETFKHELHEHGLIQPIARQTILADTQALIKSLNYDD